MKIELKWLPRKCTYCDGSIACEIVKHKFLKRISVYVCETCANEIWEEETNRRLP